MAKTITHSGTIKASVPAGNPLKPRTKEKLPNGVKAIKSVVGYEIRKKNRLERQNP